MRGYVQFINNDSSTLTHDALPQAFYAQMSRANACLRTAPGKNGSIVVFEGVGPPFDRARTRVTIESRTWPLKTPLA